MDNLTTAQAPDALSNTVPFDPELYRDVLAARRAEHRFVGLRDNLFYLAEFLLHEHAVDDDRLVYCNGTFVWLMPIAYPDRMRRRCVVPEYALRAAVGRYFERLGGRSYRAICDVVALAADLAHVSRAQLEVLP